MSLINRTLYLKTLVDKAVEKLKPLVDEYKKIKELRDSIESSLEAQVQDINNRIRTSQLQGRSEEVISNLTSQRDSLIQKITNSLSESIEEIQENILESVKGIEDEIDGISIDATISGNELVPIVTPKLNNCT